MLRDTPPAKLERMGWRCPDDATLAAYVDGATAEEEKEVLLSHLANCDACTVRVGFLVRLRREDKHLPAVPAALLTKVRNLVPLRAPKMPTRWWWASAALATAAMIAFAVIILPPAHAPVPVKAKPEVAEVHPESVLPPISPLHQVPDTAVRKLAPPSLPSILSPSPNAELSTGSQVVRWASYPGSLYYDIRLAGQDGDLLWQQRVNGTQVTLPASLKLDKGKTYFLWVRAYLRDGKSLQSRAVPFSVMKEHQQ